MRMILIIMFQGSVSRVQLTFPPALRTSATQMQKASRLGAAAALVALALSALAGLVHEDDEQHAICPQHGELVHVRAPELAPTDDDRLQPEGRPPSEHEHCALSWAPSSGELAAQRAAVHPTIGPSALAAPTLHEHRVARPLRYAPKSSPPAPFSRA